MGLIYFIVFKVRNRQDLYSELAGWPARMELPDGRVTRSTGNSCLLASTGDYPAAVGYIQTSPVGCWGLCCAEVWARVPSMQRGS